MPKIHLESWLLSLIAATFVVGVNSTDLFFSLVPMLDLTSASGVGFLASLGLLMVFAVATPLLAVGLGRLQMPLIVFVLISSSIFGYFANHMGIVFDKEMFRNVYGTILDRNTAEAMELMSLPLFRHVLLFGVIPASALLLVSIPRRSLVYEAATRLLVIVAGMAIVLGITLPNYKNIAYLAVENRDLRFKMVPVYPMASLVRLLGDAHREDRPFQAFDTDAVQHHATARRSIGIMVVGETARADHFSLNGYEKRTNPELESADGVLFSHGKSCGTSTLFSVPCMFSMRGRDGYSTGIARSESNVLDILASAGVHVAWIENNSSCQKVCDRVNSVNLRQYLDDSSPYYSEHGFYDEALLQVVDDLLGRPKSDVLLVLHMIGSHGPAYSQRFPPEYGLFTPYCEKKSPQECSDDEVLNAYDNTIVYTDHVLKMLINILQAREDEADTFLMYVSDHGESLGEQGVYLHGVPYAIAPASQTDVPFIVWFSAGFRNSHHITDRIIRNFRHARLSHDNISHTLLGLFDVEAGSRQRQQDVFSG